MKIVGYSDRFSVRPGQTIRFMVSSEAPAYRSELVRLRHTGANPESPGCKIEALESSISGEYPGQYQAIHSVSSISSAPRLGSCVSRVARKNLRSPSGLGSCRARSPRSRRWC